MANLNVLNDLDDKIKIAQTNDEVLLGFLTSLEQVEKGDDGVIWFKGWLCVSLNEKVKNEVLHEAHNSKYMIHPGITKMYQNIRMRYEDRCF